jgi:hypothetical protein
MRLSSLRLSLFLGTISGPILDWERGHTNVHQHQVRVQPVGLVDAVFGAGRAADALKPDRGVD